MKSKSAPRPVRDELLPLAERIREAVSVIGTQLEAANTTGVSPRQMRAYVSARSKPDAQVLSALAASAGFAVEWMISGAGPKLLSDSIGAAREADRGPPDDDVSRHVRARLLSACETAGVDFEAGDPDVERLVVATTELVLAFAPEQRVHVAYAVASAAHLSVLFTRQQALKKAARQAIGTGPAHRRL